MTYMWSINGGNVQFSKGQYQVGSTLRIPYRVNLIGAPGWKFAGGVSSIPGNINYLTVPTTLRLADGANCPMVMFDSTDGPIAQTETLEDGEYVENRTQASVVENILFFGNAASQTKNNCHAIFSRGKWYYTVRNCSFVLNKGYCIYIIDGNVMELHDLYLSGNGGSASAVPSKGMFLYSVSDTIINNIEAGAFNGPSIWYNASSSWLTLLSDSLVYNNWYTNSIWEVTSWTTNTVANFSSNIPLESGDPLEFRTSGSLPNPFTDLQLYFAVRFNSNSFGFHTNRELAIAGQYLPGTTPATGTNWITIGEPSGLYYSGGSRYQTAVNIRADQNSGPGVTFRNASHNQIYGLLAFKNTAPPPQNETIPDLNKVGVLFDKNAQNNFVSGLFAENNIGWIVRSNASQNVVRGVYNANGTNIVNLSTGINRVPLDQQIDGSVTITNLTVVTNITAATATIGAATVTTNATIGVAASTTTALTLNGNVGGQRILRLNRTSGITQSSGIGLAPGGFTMFDETGNQSIAVISNSGSESRILMGPQDTASPHQGIFAASTAAGTDVAGGIVRIKADQGTGNADAGDAFNVMTGDAGASGSTVQSVTTKFVVEGDGDVRVTTGNLTLSAEGKSLKIKTGGANAKFGSVNLGVGGTVTVTTTGIAANSLIFLSKQESAFTGDLRPVNRIAGTSFDILSSNPLDRSPVAWWILDPSP